jgi:hypothetical protein
MDKGIPFFKILRKAFEWSEECNKAFEQLKEYLTSPPLLSRIVLGESFFLYFAVSLTVVSLALIREEGGVQKSVYFIQVLRGVEERYMKMEKLVFILTIASRKLQPYIQAHTVKVLTKYSLKKVLQKLDLSGQLIDWAIEHSEFDIEFISQSAIKGQALTDFFG